MDLSDSEQEKSQKTFVDDRPFANVYSIQTNLDYVQRVRH